MHKYGVVLMGCDGATRLTLWLTASQRNFLQRIEARSKAVSTCACQPVLLVQKLVKENDE